MPYSDDPADCDKLRCWVEDRGWSKFAFPYCARMGDIKAWSPSEIFDRSTSGDSATAPSQSARTVSRKQLEENIFGLSGNDQFNKEFVDLVFNGERPPRYFPSEGGNRRILVAVGGARDPRAGCDLRGHQLPCRRDCHGPATRRFGTIELFPSVSDAVAERSLPAGSPSRAGRPGRLRPIRERRFRRCSAAGNE